MVYQKSIEEVVKILKSDVESGLSEEEVFRRQSNDGLNTIENKKNKSILVIFFSKFLDWLVLILLSAALISIVIDPHDFIESLVILIVLIINALIETIEHLKTSKSLEALKKLSESIITVKRDSKKIKVSSTQLVVGDIILLKKGDVVPADSRIISSISLEVDESSITGESLSVEKNHKKIVGNKITAEQVNLLFSSSSIIKGSCVAIVYATGNNSTVGSLAKSLNSTQKQSVLQTKLTQLAKVIGIISILICCLVFILEYFSSKDALSAVKSAIALSVAAIPEGLACIVTLVLTIGVNRMSKRNVIVKKLDKVETLGCVDIICTDKTGTLTENKMKVVGVYTDYYTPINKLKKESEHCLKFAKIAINYDDIDPTDQSIIEAININPIFKLNKLVPFDSTTKMSMAYVEYNENKMLVVKGAFDYILKNAIYKDRWIKAHNELAKKGLRVICVATKLYTDIDSSLNDLKIEGLIAIKDNLRSNVSSSIAEAKNASIRTIMITGDHKITATSIAKEAGILDNDNEVITSEELGKLDDSELFKTIDKYSVYARMTPFDKLRIIKAWQERGSIVAMTGDGVNDSIALHQADCGVALGSGCEVSKEAADLIIVNDDYSSLLTGVKEGRRVYANICKSVKYLLSSNIGEVLAILLLSIISILTKNYYGVALAPIHLLFVNLITDSMPAFSLGLEKAEKNLMKKPPIKLKQNIINKRIGMEIIINGTIIGIATLVAFFIGFQYNYLSAMTMAFLTLSVSQLIHAFNCKSNTTIFSKETFSNKFLNISFLFGLSISLLVVYLPVNSYLKLTQISIEGIITVFLLSTFCIISSELLKLRNRI